MVLPIRDTGRWQGRAKVLISEGQSPEDGIIPLESWEETTKLELGSMSEKWGVAPRHVLLVGGGKDRVRQMLIVSDTRAGDPEPQTVDLSPKPEAVGPSEDDPGKVSHGMEGHSPLTHLQAFLAWALS